MWYIYNNHVKNGYLEFVAVFDEFTPALLSLRNGEVLIRVKKNRRYEMYEMFTGLAFSKEDDIIYCTENYKLEGKWCKL